MTWIRSPFTWYLLITLPYQFDVLILNGNSLQLEACVTKRTSYFNNLINVYSSHGFACSNIHNGGGIAQVCKLYMHIHYLRVSCVYHNIVLNNYTWSITRALLFTLPSNSIIICVIGLIDQLFLYPVAQFN